MALIFAGKGTGIPAAEKAQYHPGVDVYWQENAWADLAFTMAFTERTWLEHRSTHLCPHLYTNMHMWHTMFKYRMHARCLLDNKNLF